MPYSVIVQVVERMNVFLAVIITLAYTLLFPALPARAASTFQMRIETGAMVNSSISYNTPCNVINTDGINIPFHDIFIDSIYYPDMKAHFFLEITYSNVSVKDYMLQVTIRDYYRGMAWDSTVPSGMDLDCEGATPVSIVVKSELSASPPEKLSFSELNEEAYQQMMGALGLTPRQALKYGYAVLDLGAPGGSANGSGHAGGYSNVGWGGCAFCDQETYYLSQKGIDSKQLVYTPGIDAGGDQPDGELGADDEEPDDPGSELDDEPDDGEKPCRN